MAATLSAAVSTVSQSITGNYSKIKVVVTLASNGTGAWNYNSCSGSVTVDGQTSAFSSSYDLRNGTETLATKEFTAYHDSEGKKTFSWSVTFDGDNEPYVGVLKTSGTYSPATIPRASAFGTITGNQLGSAITIAIDRKSSSYTHKVYYDFGTKKSQSISTNAGTSVSFTPPLSLASEIPNATKGTMKLYLETYSGSTKIGSTVTKDITVYVPESEKPSFSSCTLSVVQPSQISSWTVYVQGYTQVKITFNNAKASTGATISKYIVNDVEYDANDIVLGPLKTAGEYSFAMKLKDTRGRVSGTNTYKITVAAYAQPSIKSVVIDRCDSSGNEDEDEGEYLKATVTVDITSVGSNIYTITLYYRDPASTTSWTSLGTISNKTAKKFSKKFSIDTVYQIKVVAKDTVYSGPDIYKIVTLDTPADAINILEDRAVGIGKMVKEYDLFDVAWNARFRKDVTIDGTNYAKRFHATGWITENSSSDKAGYYFKICDVTMTEQYQEAFILFRLFDYAHGRGDSRSGEIEVRCKQQNAMGQAPYYSFRSMMGNDWDPDLFYWVVTDYSETQSIMQLWVKMPEAWTTVKIEMLTSYSSAVITMNDTMQLQEAMPTFHARAACVVQSHDTGWIDCTFASGFERYASDLPTLQVRRIGKIVHMRGVVKCASAVTPTSDTSTKIASLPSGCYPAQVERFVAQGSLAYKCMINITPTGNVYVSRYTNGTTTNMAISADWWINIFWTWFLD